MRGRTVTAAAIALSAVIGSFAATPALAACRSPRDQEIYRVEIAPLTRSVDRGGVAEVRATVVRSVEGYDLAPAEGANVIVSLSSGDFARTDGAVTDEDGVALVTIRLGRRFPAGWADARAYATREPAELPCDPYREAGGTQVARFIRVL